VSAPTLRKFLTETRAATAVEFAMIGSVLFLFIFSILLMGLAQFWQMTLDDAVRNAARQVAIGSASTTSGDHTSSDFVASVCSEFGVSVTNCAANLQYSVQEAPTFTAITPASVTADGTLNGGSNTFFNTVSNEPILVQVAFKLPFNIPLAPASLLTLNGTQALISTEAVVGEPSQ
jgi:Flp pilus assembly protein TadG